jgi:hypothetical protein
VGITAAYSPQEWRIFSGSLRDIQRLQSAEIQIVGGNGGLAPVSTELETVRAIE